MRHQDISVGSVVTLTRSGATRYGMYGIGPLTVAEIRHKPGYKTPWIIVGNGWAFRPSDLQPSQEA